MWIKAERGPKAEVLHQLLPGIGYRLALLSENASSCLSNFPFLTSSLQGSLIQTNKSQLFLCLAAPSFVRRLLTFAKLSLSCFQPTWQQKSKWNGTPFNSSLVFIKLLPLAFTS